MSGEAEVPIEEAASLVENDAGDFNITDPMDNEDGDDNDLEMIKARVKEMEEEAEKIKQMQNDIEKITPPGLLNLSFEEKMEVDGRSIYVGNVDYGATAEELEMHFHGCGSINRVTIQCDKFSSHPKGFAYIEFTDKESVMTSTALDDTLFRGRQIKVMPKRTNRPGISSTNRPPRGGGRFRRGGGRPSYGRGGYGGGYRAMRRPYRRRAAYYPY